uniref:Uncharacterized protein n=1 Tax=Ciona savignyi TaxID=51511 RepID=H2YHX7_CIOSA
KWVLVKFIVGSKDCEIPPDYREDIYSCKSENQWNTNLASLPSNLTVGSLSECSFQKYDDNFKLVALDFVVKHAVIVTGLSAPSGYSQPSSVQDFVVQLRDLANQNVLVVSAKFQTNKLSSTSCLSTQKVENYLLPKGFYGTLVVHCPPIHGCLGIENTHYNMSNHPAIKFVPILRYGYEIGDETDLLGFPAKYFEILIPAMLHFQL